MDFPPLLEDRLPQRIINRLRQAHTAMHDSCPQRAALGGLAGALEAGLEYLKSPPNDFLQKWPVSKRVNSSRVNANDATLIEKVELAAA